MVEKKLVVSVSPHITSKESTARIMRDVVIALLPALFYGIYLFGARAAVITALSILSAVLTEYLWEKATRRPVTVGDLSAVVTGVLLAMNLPPTVPYFIPVVGSAFAILIVKQLFGGIGQNFMNPALAARAFLLASWPAFMTNFSAPFAYAPLWGQVDAISSATPLALLSGTEATGALPSYWDLFMGNTGGCIGETSALLLLVGAVYLMVRKVIDLRIPLSYVATVGVLTFIFGGTNGFFTGDFLYHILSGGLILGAFYMATDYASSPVTPAGQVVYGVGCGVLTTIIRLWGGYPEGVSYSILIMNVVAPLLDKAMVPRRYGEVKAK